MERDIFYDRMIYNSMKFTYRYAHTDKGVRVVEFEEKGEELYIHYDLLFTDKYLKDIDGQDQIQLLSCSTEDEYLLVILGVVNDDIYYGLYQRDKEGYNRIKNGYCNKNEKPYICIDMVDENEVKKYFIIGFYDDKTLEISEDTKVL